MKYHVFLNCVVLLFLSCNQPNDLVVSNKPNHLQYSIPDSIIDKSNMVIIAKVGQPFFDSYIKLDSSASRYSPPDSSCINNPSNCSEFLLHPHYYMAYKFTFTSDQDYETFIELVVDTNGVVVTSREPFGIPNCPNNDCWGQFQIITKDKAIEVAQQNGFEKGIKEWSIRFHFYAGTLNNYVWEIKNTLMEDNSIPNQNTASGKVLLINAMDGSIFQLSDWMMIT